MRPVPRLVVAGLALTAGAAAIALARSRSGPAEARGAPFRPIRGFMSNRLDLAVRARSGRSPSGAREPDRRGIIGP